MNQNLIPHVGLDFVDSYGVRITNCQLVRDGKAVAIADFENGKLGRQLSAESLSSEEIGHFVNWCHDVALVNSIPARF